MTAAEACGRARAGPRLRGTERAGGPRM